MDIDGLILESRHPEYQFLIKGPMQKVWRDGFPVDEQKILILQFDRYICFVDDMTQEQEWSDEDKLFVARQLEVSLNDPKMRAMWVHEPVRPSAPWPTYDETHHKQIHVIAKATGMAAEALAYEQAGRPGGPRPEVVKNLQELVAEAQEPSEGAREADQISDEMFAV